MAIAAIIRDDHILLLKRMRGVYVGKLGLPGGPMLVGEHVAETARREARDQFGIATEFQDYVGVVSSKIFEDDELVEQYLLHICSLQARQGDIHDSEEGTAGWYPLKSLLRLQSSIIPMDFQIIQRVLLNKHKFYAECDIERNGITYKVRRFQ